MSAKKTDEDRRATANARVARWRKANPERWAAMSRAASARWAKAHPDKVRALWAVHGENRRARMRGGRVGVKSWRAILASFGHRCGYCGTRTKLTMDHVTPLARGGEHGPMNVAPACAPCNRLKHARGPLAMVNVPYVGG